MTSHTYPGTVPSALRRVRRVLRSHGFTLGKVKGRYHPFGESRTYVQGPNAGRVGCGRSIALRWVTGPYGNAPQAWKPWVLFLLRANGLPFDSRGWLECEQVTL